MINSRVSQATQDNEEILIPVSDDSTLELTEYAGVLADELEKICNDSSLEVMPGFRAVFIREEYLRSMISELRRCGVIIER